MGPVDAGQIGTMGSSVPKGVTGLASDEHAIGNVAGNELFPGPRPTWPGNRIAAADVGIPAPARHHGADNMAPDAGAKGPDELGDRQIDETALAGFGEQPV